MKKKITNSELANFIAQREGTSKSTAETFVRKFFEVVERGLLEDKYVKIKGLGTFKLVVVGERESVNVQTGERIQISGHTKVSFTPDTSLKEQVNRPFAHFMAVDLNDDTETEELDAIDQRMAEEYKDYESDDDSDYDEDNEEPEENINEGDDVVDHPEQQDPEETEHNISAEGTSLEASPVHAIDDKAMPIDKSSDNSQQSNTSNNTENGKEEGIEEHADSPIIPISSGAHQQSPTPAATSQQQDTSVSAEQAGEATPTREDADEQTMPLPSHEQEKHGSTESAHDAEDISVSAPHPINTKADLAAAQLHPASNSMGYTYSEVPARKKKNWWKTATISICALLLMACCYYVGYFRLLCPACGFSPLLDWDEPSPTESTQATRPTPSPSATPKHSAFPTQQPAAATSAAQSSQPAQDTNQAQASTSADKKRDQASVEQKPQTIQTEKTNTGSTSSNKATDTGTSTQKTAKQQSTFHKVKPGENLTRIVRRHYGSEAYVNLVIKRNHLKDANNVTVGMVLELPPKP